LDGLDECERELCGEDRREKSLIQSKRNNGTKGSEQRNHDERTNR
jgi:hypothetical protein